MMDACSRATANAAAAYIRLQIDNTPVRCVDRAESARQADPLWVIHVRSWESETQTALAHHRSVKFVTYARTSTMWQRVYGDAASRIRVTADEVFSWYPAIVAFKQGAVGQLRFGGPECHYVFFSSALHVPKLKHPVKPQDLMLSVKGVSLAHDREEAASDLPNGKKHVPKGYMVYTGTNPTALYEFCCLRVEAHYRTFYEVIRARAVALYLDIDVAKTAARRPELFDMPQIAAAVHGAVLDAARTAFAKPTQKLVIAAVESGGTMYTASDPTKISLHVVYPYVEFEDNCAPMKAFVEHVRVNALTKESLVLRNGKNAVDGGVYTRNRCWRLPAQHKALSNRLLVPCDHKEHFYGAFSAMAVRQMAEVVGDGRTVRVKQSDIKPIAAMLERPKRIVDTLRKLKRSEGTLVAANQVVIDCFGVIVADWTLDQCAWVLAMKKYLLVQPGNVVTEKEWAHLNKMVFWVLQPPLPEKLDNKKIKKEKLRRVYDAACRLLGKDFHLPFNEVCEKWHLQSVTDACVSACNDPKDVEQLVKRHMKIGDFYQAAGLEAHQ